MRLELSTEHMLAQSLKKQLQQLKAQYENQYEARAMGLEQVQPQGSVRWVDDEAAVRR